MIYFESVISLACGLFRVIILKGFFKFSRLTNKTTKVLVSVNELFLKVSNKTLSGHFEDDFHIAEVFLFLLHHKFMLFLKNSRIYETIT